MQFMQVSGKFRHKFMHQLQICIFYLKTNPSINSHELTARFPADRQTAGRHTVQNSAGWRLEQARQDSRAHPAPCYVSRLIPPSDPREQTHTLLLLPVAHYYYYYNKWYSRYLHDKKKYKIKIKSTKIYNKMKIEIKSLSWQIRNQQHVSQCMVLNTTTLVYV